MKTRESELSVVYLLFDLIILNATLVVLMAMCPCIVLTELHDTSMYILHANLAWIITYFVYPKRNLYLHDRFIQRTERITKRTFVYLIIASSSSLFILPQDFSRLLMFKSIAAFYIGKLVFYWLLYRYLKIMRNKGMYMNRAIIIGYNTTGKFLRNIMDSNLLMGYRFVGYLCDTKSDDPDLIGNTNQLADVITQYNIQCVFLTLSIFSNDESVKELLRVCNKKGVRLRLAPINQKWMRSTFNTEALGSLMLINPQEIPLDNLGARIYKRIFDIVFSLLVIVFIFSWFFPIMAFIIKLSSRGPVFFIQKRTGVNNRTFRCIKFRSMRVNALSDKVQAKAGDKRITGIGNFMRKTNFDELPQFINVLLGQMSVVGPRPHMLSHTEQYSTLIEYYLVRHYVKPGITGWAQVNGFRGETDELWKMEKRVEFDMAYIEEWSFWRDIKIIWMTLNPKAFKNAG